MVGGYWRDGGIPEKIVGFRRDGILIEAPGQKLGCR